MQEKDSNASFALFGRKYLQPSSHVLAGKDDNSPVFPADTRNSHSQAGGQKKDCVANGTQSDMYV